MDVRDFDFDLPAELIAQEPPLERGTSRLLVLDRASSALTDTGMSALPDVLRAGDLVVVKNTRVIPARLVGRRVPSGGGVECLLIRSVPDGCQTGVRHRSASSPDPRVTPDLWEALVHPGQKLKPGARVLFEGIY